MLRSLDATNAVEKGVRIDGDAVVEADDDGSKKQLERNGSGFFILSRSSKFFICSHIKKFPREEKRMTNETSDQKNYRRFETKNINCEGFRTLLILLI